MNAANLFYLGGYNVEVKEITFQGHDLQKILVRNSTEKILLQVVKAVEKFDEKKQCAYSNCYSVGD